MSGPSTSGLGPPSIRGESESHSPSATHTRPVKGKPAIRVFALDDSDSPSTTPTPLTVELAPDTEAEVSTAPPTKEVHEGPALLAPTPVRARGADPEKLGVPEALEGNEVSANNPASHRSRASSHVGSTHSTRRRNGGLREDTSHNDADGEKHVNFPLKEGSTRSGSGSASGSGSGSDEAAPKPPLPVWKRAIDKILAHPEMAWIKPKMNFQDWKPVLRVSLSMWLGYVLVLIHKTGLFLGMAAFLVLIVSCMIPPQQPFVQVVEVLCNLFFYLALSWAWVVIGTAIAYAVRVPTDPAKIAAAEAMFAFETNPTIKMVKVAAEGTYLQAKPAVVCSVFLCVGTGAFLWWKMRTAPSPATFPLVLSCILMDVSLTLIPLYPNAYYMAPFLVFRPICIQAGIGLLCSAVIFPQSVSHLFRRRFTGVVSPLLKGMDQIEELFSDASTMSSFADEHHHHHHAVNFDLPPNEVEEKLAAWGDRSDNIRKTLLGSLTGMAPLQAIQRYLSVDISYGRLSGEDLDDLFESLTSMQVRASGLSFFFNAIVNKIRHTHIDSVAFSAQNVISHSQSRPASRPPSRPSSRPGSIRNSESVDANMNRMGESTPSRPTTPLPADSEDEHDEQHHTDHHESLARRLHLHLHRSSKANSKHGSTSGLHSHKGSHLSLLEHLRKAQQPVGVYESQRYMDVERGDDRDLVRIVQQLELLSNGSLPLVKALRQGLTLSLKWAETGDRKRYAMMRDMQRAYSELNVMLQEFREHRTEVIRPYAHLFDPSHPSNEAVSGVHHKGLYYCFVAQYHLMEFGEAAAEFLGKVVKYDEERQKRRWWFPRPFVLFRQFRQSVKSEHETGAEAEDDEGVDHDEHDDELGEARRRNPDYEPFNSTFLILLSKLSFLPDILFSRSAMYALKAGVLSCLTSLPAFLASSCSFYYYNRGIWATIMAQMTLAVFSGDTFSSWLSRIIASFWGGIVGLAMWYIGSGNGKGNAYGLAVVTAIIFPLACFYRLYYPVVLTTVVFTTSMCLVVGYSFLNGHLFRLTNASWGWDVAWLRFVCVVIGITCAWLFSYVPPSYSAKLAIRNSYARSINTAGRILCQILSAANDPHNEVLQSHNKETRKDLIKARAKLAKLGVRHANAKKEYSFRGRWPEENYKGLLNTLVETMSLLAQFNHLLPQMDVKWRRALLSRTRMSDPLFLGDVLAVISMTSAALNAGTPLPQITPGPLIAKYHMNKYKGLDLPLDPAGGYDDAPTLVTVEVLESDDYMRYALGVATVYALMSRLDGLVVVCKTLLGETFHISNMRLGDYSLA